MFYICYARFAKKIYMFKYFYENILVPPVNKLVKLLYTMHLDISENCILRMKKIRQANKHLYEIKAKIKQLG